MARGRIITNAIAIDKRVNDLSDDTCRLALTWLITFADKEGRTYGAPAVVRSLIFPRRDDVTIAQVEGYIQEWETAGIIQWYTAAGDKWIAFVDFAKNQPGLKKYREPESQIPAPPRSPHCGTYRPDGVEWAILHSALIEAEPPAWPTAREAALERDFHTCRYCGASADQVDHVFPQSRGGTNHLFNLVAACHSCNMGKGSGPLPPDVMEGIYSANLEKAAHQDR